MLLPLRSPLNLPSKYFERRQRKGCKDSKSPEILPTILRSTVPLVCCPALGYKLTDLTHSLFSLSLSLEQVVIRSEPTPTPLSNPFPPPSVFVLSGDLAPSHQSIRFSVVPSGSFWRCFHLIISLKKIFFPGQHEVTDHISAAFRLSDHLIKPRSISLPLFSDHLFFLGLRGEACGLGPPNPIPAKALELDWVTYTNSRGFRAWLSVPYSPLASPEILLLAPDPRRYSSTPNVLFDFSTWSTQVSSWYILISLSSEPNQGHSVDRS